MTTSSLSAAQQHLVCSSVTIDGNWMPLSSTLESIGAVTGVGIQLYFTFLKYVGWAFFAWACFQFPMLVVNFQSTAGSGATGFALTTAYNLGEAKKVAVKENDIGPLDSWHIPGFGEVVIHDMVAWFGILDAAGLVVFISIVGWFCYRALPKMVRRFDEDNVTPSDFSIEISGLPERVPDHKTYEAQLTEHIIIVCQRARREAGMEEDPNPDYMVLENCLVRDYNGRLLQFQNLEKLQKKLVNALQKKDGPKKEIEIKQTEYKMHKLRLKSKAPVKAPEDRGVKKRAYVMLNNCENKDVLLNYYRFANSSILRCCQKQHMRFHGHALKVVEAPEPSNIMWENQDRNEWRVCVRKCITILLALVMFSVSFAIIFASKAYTKLLQDTVGKCVPRSHPVTVDNWVSRLAAGKIDVCGCEELGFVTVSTISELSSGVCKQWLRDAAILKVLTLCGAFVIVIVNLILQHAVIFLTKMEQPLSLSSYYSSLATKIFVAQFFNTAIIILLVNTEVITDLIGLKGGLDDFERQWYSRVGVAIILTMVVQAFSPHCIQVAIYPIRICIRRLRSVRATTQLDLNALYTWPQFQLAVRLAGLLNVVFSTMLYSAGLPFLSISAMVTFFLVFFCDKFLLLRASKMPPMYDQTIILVFKQVFPIACFLHASFAIYMFGNPRLFPSSPVSDDLDSENFFGEAGFSFITVDCIRLFFTRCLSGAGFPNFVVWLLVVCFLVLKLVKLVLGVAFGNFVRAACSCCIKLVNDSKKDMAENRTTSRASRDEARRRKSAMLFTYAVEENPTYAGLVQQANAKSRDSEVRLTIQEEDKNTSTMRSTGSTDGTRRPPARVSNSPDDEEDALEKTREKTEPTSAVGAGDEASERQKNSEERDSAVQKKRPEKETRKKR